jgi:endonuclease G
MKQLLVTFILLALGTTIAGQDKRESVIIQTEIFKVEYNEVLEQPMWVEYTVQCPNGDASRKGLDFWEPKGVHTSDDDDYSNNIWDKGHLAPAAAFNCSKEMLKKTFSYLNSALQHESLNRGIWNRLEGFERNLANFYEVEVRIDVLFEGHCEVLPSGATIPSGFRKTIMWDGRKEVFLFPNSNTKGTDWKDYHITE